MKKLLLALVIVALLVPAALPVLADSIYVVQPGDTLTNISTRFGVNYAQLVSVNNITNPSLIFVGQRLIIPGPGGPVTTPMPTTIAPGPTAVAPPAATVAAPGGVYIVQTGDNLFRIALKFNVTVQAIQTANGLTNNLIFLGQRLIIPASGQVVTSPPRTTPTPPPPAGGGNTTPPPATATPLPSGIYIVQSGDNLFRISLKFGVSVAAISAANGLSNNLIFVGQRLVIPGAGSGGTTPPPAGNSGGFELGGQVANFSAPDKMKHAGMTWVKRQVRWHPGDTASTGSITDAHNQGFKILLSVLGEPASIAGGANYDDYARFVGELARGGADAIEVWNEMNLDREWPMGEIDPAKYTDLLRRAYTKIKANNPNTMVISGAPSPTGAEGAFGLSRVWNDDRYMRGMAAAGAAKYMDCIGVHYNEGIISPTRSSGDPRDPYYTRYYGSMVSVYYNAFGGARKICFTELGYLTGEGYGTLPGAFGWAGNTTVAQQAQWIGEAASLARSGGQVRLLIVFNVDFTVWGDDPQAGFAIIRPGGVCPACDSLRNVTGGR